MFIMFQQNLNIWLGGLFNPEAYITATRQFVAQANGWSLEELQLQILISDSTDAVPDSASFGVLGLTLQGAEVRQNQLQITSKIFTQLPLTCFKWIRTSDEYKQLSNHTSTTINNNKVTLPVYLNSTRSELLFSVEMELCPGESDFTFYERGIAFICSSSTI